MDDGSVSDAKEPQTMRNFLLFLLPAFLTLSAYGEVNESADYVLDKDSSRTHSFIKSGNMKTKITKFNRSNETYTINAKYNLNVSFMGRQQGQRNIDVPKEYVDGTLLERLRREKQITMPKYKMRHKGYATVRTIDGNSYSDCDIIEFYDIDTSDMDGFYVPYLRMLQDTASLQFNFERIQADIKDLKILAHVHQDVPVLGAAKVDLSGIARGFRFTAGFDYKR